MSRMALAITSLTILLLVVDPAAAQRRGGSYGGGRPGGNGGPGGGPGAFDPTGWIKRIDKNGNGTIDPDEAKSNEAYMLRQMAARNPKLDLSRPVKIEAINEIVQEGMREYSRSRDERDGGRDRRDDGRSSGSPRSSYGNSNRPSASAKPLDPVVTKNNLKSGYRFGSAWDRLPDGLPEWFRERDENQDGQILMVEFAKSWTDELAAEFFSFDLNQDGVITPQECLDTKDKAASASSRVAASTPRPSSDAPGETDSNDESETASSAEPAAAAATGSADLQSGGYSKLVVSYVTDIYKRDDKNGDGAFTKEEWAEHSRNPEVADKNKDGKVTQLEYADWLSGK